MVDLKHIIANLEGAARNGLSIDIGGGVFGPAECKAAAATLKEAPAMLEALRNMVALANEAITAREESDDPQDHQLLPDYQADYANALAILARIDGTAKSICPHCGRDNTGFEGEPCSDECPQYWEAVGRVHPDYPTAQPAPPICDVSAPDALAVADALEAGCAADIWYHASDYGDEGAVESIVQTQSAMIQAVKLLRGEG